MNHTVSKLRILHTSDWHIGRRLYGRKRYEECESFLKWIIDLIEKNKINVLLVAGDIFDSTTPSNRSQELYYCFLYQLSMTCCRHAVIIAGNHDSPTFLNAPKELLKAFNVHVVGSITESLENEILVLHNKFNEPELIVCAVPYLRDRDIRTIEAGESIDDKKRKLIEGIQKHYTDVFLLAEQKRQELGVKIPVVAMGHLFTDGGQTSHGVRDLYIGSLAHVPTDTFHPGINYTALGHLHIPQKVNESEVIRYSGSPLPIGFGEANQQKSICQIEFHNTKASVQLINVPVFQLLESIKGNRDTIVKRIMDISEKKEPPIWLEVVYDGTEVIGNLQEELEKAVVGTRIEIINIKNTQIYNHVLKEFADHKSLDDLKTIDVFKKCLDINNIPKEQQLELCQTYQEALSIYYEQDTEDSMEIMDEDTKNTI